jgi:hypothetical protein
MSILVIGLETCILVYLAFLRYALFDARMHFIKYKIAVLSFFPSRGKFITMATPLVHMHDRTERLLASREIPLQSHHAPSPAWGDLEHDVSKEDVCLFTYTIS